MLTLRDTDAIRRIEEAIGYTFRDKRLLVQVFTRKTYMKIDPEAPDNEVLEFYGDTLMSYHVTTYFVEKFAHMLHNGLYFMRTVEQFTEMRSHYVKNQYLTERIKQLLPNIDRLLRAQNPRAELPKENQKAYADLFESLIGAVYLDSYQDEKLIRAFILRHLDIEPKAGESAVRGRSRTVTLPSVSLVGDTPVGDTLAGDTPVGDAPALSDEVEDDMATPAVEDMIAAVADRPKDRAPAPVDTAEEPADTTATATPIADDTPTAPETAHAGMAAKDETAGSPLPTESMTPCRDALAAFCREMRYDAPVYGEAPKNAPNARPVATCTVCFRNLRGKPVKISLNDSGKTSEEAFEKVARKMLAKLQALRAAEEVQTGKRPAAAVEEKQTAAAARPATSEQETVAGLPEQREATAEAAAPEQTESIPVEPRNEVETAKTEAAEADTPCDVSPAPSAPKKRATPRRRQKAAVAHDAEGSDGSAAEPTKSPMASPTALSEETSVDKTGETDAATAEGAPTVPSPAEDAVADSSAAPPRRARTKSATTPRNTAGRGGKKKAAEAPGEGETTAASDSRENAAPSDAPLAEAPAPTAKAEPTATDASGEIALSEGTAESPAVPAPKKRPAPRRRAPAKPKKAAASEGSEA